MEGILVPIALFALIAVARYFKSVERQKMMDTVRAAIEKGQPLPPELIAAMSAQVRRRPLSPRNDLHRGVIWLGVAAGVAVMGVVIGFSEPDATYPLLGIAAFPAFIGLAFIIMSLVAKEPK